MKAFLGSNFYAMFGWLIRRLFIANSTRARALIQVKDEILLSKTTLGDHTWELPGGGVGKNETKINALIREIYEELNIKIDEKSPKLLVERKVKDYAVSYDGSYYKIDLETKPDLVLQWPWMLDARWFKLGNLPEKIKPMDKEIIEKFSSTSA